MYLLRLLEEFLDTDIRGVVNDVILVSTFFGEGIPAIRFSLARLAASTINAVSDFLLITCEEMSYFSSLSLMSDLATTRDCREVVSIGGRLMDDDTFFKDSFGGQILVDASVLTSGGREAEGGRERRSSGCRSTGGCSKLGR